MRQRRKETLWMEFDERTVDLASASADNVDDAPLAEAETQTLRSAMNRLKQRDRDLLVMKYFTVILPSRWFYRARMKHRLL